MLEFVKGFLKVTTMAVLAAIVISLAYLAGFGSGATWSSPVSSTALASFHLLPTAESMPPPSGDAALDKDFRVFWEAWRLIDRDFYGPLPDTRQRTYGAIRGMLQSLKDEHTTFLDPEQAAVLQSDDSGSFKASARASVSMRQ